jgi:hypothetical protein
MWTYGMRLGLVLAVLGLSLPVWAADTILLKQSDGTTTPLGGSGNAANVNVVSGGTGGTNTATATAAAPTNTEGASSSLWVDLAGLLHIAVDAFNVLFFFEDPDNQLARVSGGAVRITPFSSVTSATSSTTQIVPVGPKTFMGQIINATSETKAATALVYGNWTNSTTGAILICTLTLPSTATVLQLQDVCPVITANFTYYFYTVSVYTSASSAPFTLYAMY